jgi:hypothetical protein
MEPEELTFDDLALMVAEGLDGIEAETLEKVVRVMFDATVQWSEEKDRYLVTLGA